MGNSNKKTARTPFNKLLIAVVALQATHSVYCQNPILFLGPLSGVSLISTQSKIPKKPTPKLTYKSPLGKTHSHQPPNPASPKIGDRLILEIELKYGAELASHRNIFIYTQREIEAYSIVKLLLEKNGDISNSDFPSEDNWLRIVESFIADIKSSLYLKILKRISAATEENIEENLKLIRKYHKKDQVAQYFNRLELDSSILSESIAIFLQVKEMNRLNAETTTFSRNRDLGKHTIRFFDKYDKYRELYPRVDHH